MLYDKFLHNLSQLRLEKCDEQCDSFVVAFSGGVDSTALLLLSSIYAKQHNNKLVAVTIDHQLRPESSKEAAGLTTLCNSLQIEHVVLRWEHSGVAGNVMEQARDARYKLLTNFCNDNGIGLILTAHHLDDNIENFFIKLSRGSGIKGLVEHNKAQFNGVLVGRPLFDITKSELLLYVQDKGVPWVEDSSNVSDKYFRNVIRKNLDSFLTTQYLQPDLFKKRIATSQKNLEYVAKVFDYFCNQILSEHVKVHDYGFVTIQNVSQIKFIAVWHEILCKYLCIVSGQVSKLPRRESLQHTIEQIITVGDFVSTLHGCNIAHVEDTILIYRELGKSLPYAVPCSVGNTWDGRFEVISDVRDAYVDLMHPEEYMDVKDDYELILLEFLPKKYHKKISLTLPVVRFKENIINYKDASEILRFKIA